MALNNDERIYSGGGVVFDPRPYTQLYAQLAQRKAAKDEAFDEYMRGLNKSVNPAGVRNVDRPIIDKAYQDWQEFGLKNRDGIRGRKGGADIEFNRKHQSLLNLIAESKQEEEKKKPLVELMLDPDKRDRIGDAAIEEIHSHDQPLYVMGANGLERNPNRKSLDYSSLTFNPKPFNQGEFDKLFSGVKRTDLPPQVTLDPTTKTQTTTTKSVFDQEGKNKVAEIGVTEYMNNPSFKQMVNKLNPEEYNDFFKENFGHDIENKGDLAAAYALKRQQQSINETKVTPDVFGRQVAMEGIRDANAKRRQAITATNQKALVDYRRAGNKKDQEGVLEGYIQRAFDEGKGTERAISIKGKFVPGRDVLLPKKYKDLYVTDDVDKEGNKIKLVPKFVMTSDKKYVLPVYPGKPTDYRQPIPVETFKNELGQLWLTKKDAAAEMGEVDFEDEEIVEEPEVQESAPVDDSYSRADLKSNGWTDDQINQAVKAGKIKVK